MANSEHTEPSLPTFSPESGSGSASAPRSAPSVPPPSPPPRPSSWLGPLSALALTLAVLALIGDGVIWYLTDGSRRLAGAQSPAPVAAVPITDSNQTRLDVLTRQLDDLKSRLDTLQGRVENLPQPLPTPDLKPIQSKLDELNELPQRVATLDSRVQGVEKSLASVREDTTALKNDVERFQGAESPTATTSTLTPVLEPEKPKLAGEPLILVAERIRSGQAAEVVDDLGKLREQFPQDARVWYLSALANGYKTGDWSGGDIMDFVHRGIDLEKAGTPDRVTIDAALDGLDPGAIRWITYYRDQAKSP